MSVLNSPRVAAVLHREHEAARAQRQARKADDLQPQHRPRQGVDFRTSERHRTSYLSIGPAQGRWLYGQAIAISAKEIVEFGTSYGISTIYLAAAAAQTGGRVTGTEYHPAKAEKARKNLQDTGLEATVLTGDARKSLSGNGPDIDLLFLDGANDLYLPVLQMLLPRIRRGGVVIADNIPLQADERAAGSTAEFDAFISSEKEDFISTVIGFGKGGMSFSVRL